MWVGWLLSPKPLQLLMVEEGLHPKIVIHSKSLELLGQREVCEDHMMDLNHKKLVFNQNEDRFVTTTCCPDGSPLQTSLEKA